MTAAAAEGVIKFELAFRSGPPPTAGLVTELNAWRAIFRRLGLLGQNPDCYQGLGFGNLSRRLPGRSDHAFLISGTQTGGLESLGPEHYALVETCDPAANRISATGAVKPSSEALSHGVLYQADPAIEWVLHLHSPEIFSCYRQLGLPATASSAAYGTPALAVELERLVRTSARSLPDLIIMAGHQDGILAFGAEPQATGSLVIQVLFRALKFSHCD